MGESGRFTHFLYSNENKPHQYMTEEERLIYRNNNQKLTFMC